MNVFLGIDGGATHARAAVVGAGGDVLLEIGGGPLNFYAQADAEVRSNLRDLIAGIHAGLPPSARLAGTVIGSAAVLEEARSGEAERLCQGVLKRGEVKVVSDCLTALHGACAGETGILVISGTGSVVAARDRSGALHRVGGWGHIFGDEGSAYWVATKALAEAARDADAHRVSPLGDAICAWLQVSDLVEGIPRIYESAMDKTRLAGLAAFLAQRLPGEEAVLRLFREAGEQLAVQAARIIGRGDFGSEADIPLYMAGSVLEKKRHRAKGLGGSIEGLRGCSQSHRGAGPRRGGAVGAPPLYTAQVRGGREPMNGMDAYLSGVQERLGSLLANQRDALELAAEKIAAALKNAGWLYLFGTGHSHMLAEELFFRAGGSPRVRPLLVDALMLHQSASESSDRERDLGRAANLLAEYPVSDRDVLVIASNSGRNAVPIELAMGARERGAYTVALTSRAHARSFPARHPSGKRLDQVVDLVLDNGAPAGDASVEVGESGLVVGAVSTVLGAAVLQMLHVRAMERLAQGGVTPEIFVSNNSDGGAANAALLEKYSGSVKHL